MATKSILQRRDAITGSALKAPAGWVVRAMNQAVAIQARFARQAQRFPIPASARQTGRAVDLAWMRRIRMAVLAQVGRPDLEEICTRRAVRIMTVGAVFAHWRMLPQERTALLGMASIAGLVD